MSTADTKPDAVDAFEYRVTWRREGGRLRHRVFQSRRGADDLYEKLLRYTPEDRDLWPCWWPSWYREGSECANREGCDCGVATGSMQRVVILKISRRQVFDWLPVTDAMAVQS